MALPLVASLDTLLKAFGSNNTPFKALNGEIVNNCTLFKTQGPEKPCPVQRHIPVQTKQGGATPRNFDMVLTRFESNHTVTYCWDSDQVLRDNAAQ